MNFCQCGAATRQPTTYTGNEQTGYMCVNCSRWINPMEPIVANVSHGAKGGRMSNRLSRGHDA